MLVQSTSRLWKLPLGLHPEQAGPLDALRLSIQFIDATYQRIVGSAEILSHNSDPTGALGPIALMDAWALVDAVARVRSLVMHLPRYRGRAPSKRIFMQRTESVEVLRNRLQHLVGDMRELNVADRPVLGTLTWVKPINLSTNECAVYSFTGGQLRGVAHTVEMPAKVPSSLTQIELWSDVSGCNITAMFAAVADLLGALEASVDRAFSGGEAPCDAVAFIHVQLDVESGVDAS